jgi:hypothetical protein
MFRNGALAWTPALVFSSGHDTNVYREEIGFADYETFVVPQMQGWWVHPGFAVTLNGAVEVVHFANNVGATNSQAGVQIQRRQSRIRPFAGLNHRRTNANPTGFEVGYKSLRLENDMSAGVRFITSPRSQFDLTARYTKTGWDADAIYQTSSLREKLNRDTTGVGGSFSYAITPLTSVGGRVEYSEDRFKFSPLRDGKTTREYFQVAFSKPAVVFGTASVGFEHFKSEASGAADFNGLVTAVSVGYGTPDGTLLKFYVNRDTQYSFDTSLAYFVLTGYNVTASRRVGRAWDTAAFFNRYSIDYSQAGLPASVGRGNVVTEYGGAIAYRVGRWGRIGATAEHAQETGSVHFSALRMVGFLTYGSGRFQRLDRPIPFEQ